MNFFFSASHSKLSEFSINGDNWEDKSSKEEFVLIAQAYGEIVVGTTNDEVTQKIVDVVKEISDLPIDYQGVKFMSEKMQQVHNQKNVD